MLHEDEARRLEIERQGAGNDSKSLESGPDGMSDAGGDLVGRGYTRSMGNCLDFFWTGFRHAAFTPLAGARLCPEPGMAM